jgi:hypothetical protein
MIINKIVKEVPTTYKDVESVTHECDLCHCRTTETKGNWLKGWIGFKGTCSYFYGCDSPKEEFCSWDCLAKWAHYKDNEGEVCEDEDVDF